MRPEKKYLVESVDSHLAKGDYIFITDYRGITVKETALLRKDLAVQGAEFHVVKNSIFNVAVKKRGLPALDDLLAGQVAIIVGGKNPSEVAKIVTKYAKDKDKVHPRGGLLGASKLSAKDLEKLSTMPSIEVLKAQFLGLLNTPAQQLVRVINAVPQGMINVLDAKRRLAEDKVA